MKMPSNSSAKINKILFEDYCSIRYKVSGEAKVENESFKAVTRYSGSSLVVTIPMRVRRNLELELGDKVRLNISKLIFTNRE